MDAQQDVVRYSSQVGWLALAAIVLGVVVAAAGSEAFGVVLAVLGAVSYLVTRYLIGRYR